MITIHKFELRRTKRQTIEIDPEAVILKVGMQSNNLCLWARVNTGLDFPDKNLGFMEIAIYATGEEIDIPVHCLEYIGSVSDSPYEWHIFEILEGLIPR